MKKKRKLERAAEREQERADVAAAEAVTEVELADGEEKKFAAVESKGKRAREERERRRGTVPYGLGEKILLVGEGELACVRWEAQEADDTTTGNFSFAHSLLLMNPPVVTPHLLLATSFDTLEAALAKYPDLMLHVNAIREKGAKAIFGVDATDLKKCKEVKEGREWDRVGFNFPHVGASSRFSFRLARRLTNDHAGAGITDQNRNVRANQTLILRFFRSVAPFLRQGKSASTDIHNVKKKALHASIWTSKRTNTNKKRKQVNSDDEADRWGPLPTTNDDGEAFSDAEDADDAEDEANVALALAPPPPTTAGTVLVTLRTTAPYSLWSLPHLGTRGSLIAPSILPRPLPPIAQPNYKVLRSFDFMPADYEGYEHRRTIGFKEGVSSGKNEDLSLSARERGEKRREEKEGKERDEKEERGEKSMGKGAMRTYEFELAEQGDADDLYD